MNIILIIIGILVLINIILLLKNQSQPSCNSNEKYTTSDGNLLLSDNNGNLSLTPNVLNDLQTQITTLSTQLQNQITTQSTQLQNQINNIINGTTNLQNTNIDGQLKINTYDGRPLIFNKKNDKTALLSYQLNGNEYNAHGVDGNGNKWSGTGWW